ncbi:FAD-dependent oxidoreductase [Microbacterium sp. Marseille-Q6965]|uniref:FAD-dependent oxidoreductase n=1 Tax=Microbacterium sp. Marseille-Q6965 TaxID=2965072 RepID=UPI0021B704D7|nr:FAD-dependent oxidoreductase [Microbacterium sp. Marseille-Q6965]
MTDHERLGRVAVVGAGVIGSAIAAALVDRGARVTQVSESEGLSAASRASFAWVNAHGKMPEPYRALNAEGRAWHARHGASWFVPTGSIVDGVPDERDGYVDVDRFLAVHRARVGATGAVVTGRVLGLGRARTGISLEGTGVVADTVVIAAGTGTAALVGSLTSPNSRIGSARGPRGFAVRLRAPSAAVGRVVVDRGLLLRPDHPERPDLVVAQSLAVEQRLRSRPSSADDAATIWTEMRRELATRVGGEVRDAEPVSVHVADRPRSADGYPVLGWVAPGVYVVLSHSGVTLALLLADLAARDLVGDIDPRLEAYRP